MNDRFTSAGRASYALLGLLAQDEGRTPLRLRIFMDMLANTDSNGRVTKGITVIIKGLNTTVNNKQAYQAIAELIDRDWIQREKGVYYVNPALFWRGRLDQHSANWLMAMDYYKGLGNGRANTSK